MGNTLCNLVNLDEYYAANNGEFMPYWLLVIKKNRDLYNKYKENNSIALTEDESKQVRFLSIVDKLGFPMDEAGTHLYKDVVMATYDEIMTYRKEDAQERALSLLEELQDRYSSFFHVIARDEYEIGNDSFHMHVAEAVKGINSDDVDDMVKDAIFGVDYVEENPYTQAFRIASYMAKKDMKKGIQKETTNNKKMD